LKRQVDWLVNGSLTGPIFSRALNQLTQLEIFPARDKDWPVNECNGLLNEVAGATDATREAGGQEL
jgi:hypothetical protein